MDERTPLLIAARHGKASVVAVLLAAGANKNHRDIDENSALELAEDNGHTEVIDLLRK